MKKKVFTKYYLDEIDKMISSSDNRIHQSTGCYYVLIGLTEVSYEIAQLMPWLVYSIKN